MKHVTSRMLAASVAAFAIMGAVLLSSVLSLDAAIVPSPAFEVTTASVTVHLMARAPVFDHPVLMPTRVKIDAPSG